MMQRSAERLQYYDRRNILLAYEKLLGAELNRLSLFNNTFHLNLFLTTIFPVLGPSPP